MPSSLPEPIARLIAAVNDGDTDSFVSTFTPDGTVSDRGRALTGREAIRAWSDREFIGVGVTIDVTAEITTREHATVTATVLGGGFTGRKHLSFTVADGLVADMVIAD